MPLMIMAMLVAMLGPGDGPMVMPESMMLVHRTDQTLAADPVIVRSPSPSPAALGVETGEQSTNSPE